MTEALRIGVLDSGFLGSATARRGWEERGEDILTTDTPTPLSDHGTLVASLLREGGPAAALLLDAQIFGARLHCRAEVAAAGLDWLCESGAQVVNTSWGLVGDNPTLHAAVARALEAGVWIVAATPIRGASPAPARYPGVISATGDARCSQGELSHFGGDPAEFGATPSPELRLADNLPPLSSPRGGSSFACARVCAALANVLVEHPGVDPREVLWHNAAHRGPQQAPRP